MSDHHGAHCPQRTRSAPVEAGFVDHESIARDSRAIIDAWPGCRSPFRTRTEMALVPVSPLQHETQHRQRATLPIPLLGMATATCRSATYASRRGTAYCDSRNSSSSPRAHPKLARGHSPASCSPPSSPVDDWRSASTSGEEEEERNVHRYLPRKSGPADHPVQNSTRMECDAADKGGNKSGGGVVKDFTWMLSSSAASCFVQKHLLRQDHTQSWRGSACVGCARNMVSDHDSTGQTADLL